MSSILWHNGEFKNEDAAIFAFQDRIRYGDGIFDTLLVIDGQVLYADEHLARLHRHLDIFGIHADITRSDMDTVISENAITSGRYALNIIITRGLSERGLNTPDHNNASIAMRLSELPPISDAPITAIIAKSVRRNEGSPLSRIKSLNYGDAILAMREAETSGANTALMLNNAGHITCAVNGNIYIRMDDGQLYTPPLSDGAMDGIIRGVAMTYMDIKERSLTPDDLARAENLYMSNSIRGIVPIVALDGTAYPALPLPLNDTILKP